MRPWGALALIVAAALLTAHLAARGIAARCEAGGEPELSDIEIRGNVVLVELWTLGCCYCTNTLPYVKSWHERYAEQGLSVIGVHSPEFAYYANDQLARERIDRERPGFPVILDPELKIWRSCCARRWPTILLKDRQGRVRSRFEGALDARTAAVVEAEVRRLLLEPASAAQPSVAACPQDTSIE